MNYPTLDAPTMWSTGVFCRPVTGPDAVPATVSRPGRAARGRDASREGGGRGFLEMVELFRRGERLAAELRALRPRVAEARAYLARPDANPALGRARLEQLRVKHSGLLALMRANRIEARALLARPDAADGPLAIPA